MPSRLLHPALCSRSENTEATKRQRPCAHSPTTTTATSKRSTPQKTKLHPPPSRAIKGKATPARLAELKNGRTIVDVFLDVSISRLFVQPAPSCSMNNNNKLVARAGDGWMEKGGGGGRLVSTQHRDSGCSPRVNCFSTQQAPLVLPPPPPPPRLLH